MLKKRISQTATTKIKSFFQKHNKVEQLFTFEIAKLATENGHMQGLLFSLHTIPTRRKPQFYTLHLVHLSAHVQLSQNV